MVRAPRNPAGRGRSGSGGRLPALAAFETSAAAPGSSQEVGGTPTLASFKVRASRLPGRGHIEPSSAQQPSEPHIQLPAVPRIRCPPPKPPSLSHSPSCPPLTATGASSGEAQVGVLRGPGTLGHLGYCVCVERRVPLLIGTTRLVSGSRFLLWFSLGLLSRKERSLEVKASASPPLFFFQISVRSVKRSTEAVGENGPDLRLWVMALGKVGQRVGNLQTAGEGSGEALCANPGDVPAAAGLRPPP